MSFKAMCDVIIVGPQSKNALSCYVKRKAK